MLTMFGIPNCNTVKKARAWLDAHGIEYRFHDFKKLGLDEVTAGAWLQQQTWEKLINRAGTTWRGLSDAEKAEVQSAHTALALMLRKHSVIKRPVMVRDDVILCLGYDEQQYQQLFL